MEYCQIEKYCKLLQDTKAENEKLKSNIYLQTNYTTQQFYTKEEYERLQAENERLKEENELIKERSKELYTFSATYENDKLKQALQEIKAIAEDGLQSICYKANCATCRCYSKKISNDTLENIINDYFDEDGDFTDTEGDFFEVLQAFIDRERVACNKAQPISEKILAKINEVIGAE